MEPISEKENMRLTVSNERKTIVIPREYKKILMLIQNKALFSTNANNFLPYLNEYQERLRKFKRVNLSDSMKTKPPRITNQLSIQSSDQIQSIVRVAHGNLFIGGRDEKLRLIAGGLMELL